MDGAVATDLEGDTSDDEPTMGATEAKLPSPEYFFGMRGLFPGLREPGGAPAYVSAGFCQLAAWAGPTDARTDEAEPCCEDEGAQCDDEGARFDDEDSGDSGVVDWGGGCDGYAGGPLAGPVFYT